MDQCATCIKMRASIRNADPHDRPRFVDAWKEHKRQADKGYMHRAICISTCKREWAGVELTPPAEAIFPPPPPSIPVLSHPSKTDFTQNDMGGGLRTPLIKSGPQYFLRTLPSKPFYICSSVRGTCAFWWNETIAGVGAQDIISVQYLYDTTRYVIILASTRSFGPLYPPQKRPPYLRLSSV